MVKKLILLLGIRKTLLVIVAAIFINPWIWKIFINDLLLFILIITLTYSLFQVSYFEKCNKIFIKATFSLFLVISTILIYSAFDKNIFILNQEETLRQNSYHLYFAGDLGRLYLNKVGLYFHQNIDLPLSKLQSNLFSNLDLNLYFFASHPRERLGVGEFEKYPFFTLPFFIIGLISFLRQKLRTCCIYLISATLISMFIRPDYIYGPILFSPVISISIAFGILHLLGRQRG